MLTTDEKNALELESYRSADGRGMLCVMDRTGDTKPEAAWYDTPEFRERFAAFVQVKEGGCWEWTGTAPAGYGQIHAGKRDGRNVMVLAHRAAWEMGHGSLKDELWVLHSCDNPLCCRLDHLFVGTAQDNSDDMVTKGRSCKGRKYNGFVSFGERNGNSKLTAEIVAEIRWRVAILHESFRSLAARFGVSKKLVSDIVRRKIWKHVPDVTSILPLARERAAN